MKRTAGLICAILALLVPAASGAFDGQPVYVDATCTGHSLRPIAIDVSCGDGPLLAFGDIRYSSYGATEAYGHGVLHDGSRVLVAELVLYELERCADGRLYYNHIRVLHGHVNFETLIGPKERCVILDLP